MKRIALRISLLGLVMFSLLSQNVQGQEIKYKKILKAKGTLNWKLEDMDGNVVSEGKIVDGEWRLQGAMLIDYLILDKDENNNIKTVLAILGDKRCPMLSFPMQVYHDGEFYPGKKYKDRYEIRPKKWDDTGLKYGMGNKNLMLFSFGAVSCKYRAMYGCMPNRIKIPHPDSYLKAELGGKYVFYILGGTDYQWEK